VPERHSAVHSHVFQSGPVRLDQKTPSHAGNYRLSKFSAPVRPQWTPRYSRLAKESGSGPHPGSNPYEKVGSGSRDAACAGDSSDSSAPEGGPRPHEAPRKPSFSTVDKTGTLTTGRRCVLSVTTADGSDASESLRLAASVERASAHPLAAAITAHAVGLEDA
jgi:hypothetical protein